MSRERSSFRVCRRRRNLLAIAGLHRGDPARSSLSAGQTVPCVAASRLAGLLDSLFLAALFYFLAVFLRPPLFLAIFFLADLILPVFLLAAFLLLLNFFVLDDDLSPADFSIAKSLRDAPVSIARLSQPAMAPRPLQVSPVLGLRYFGATLRPRIAEKRRLVPALTCSPIRES